MDGKRPMCDVCGLQQESDEPTLWCSECEQMACSECQEGHRYHKSVPLANFKKLPIEIQNISAFCGQHHHDAYELYCNIHRTPCCGKCFVESHNECCDISSLNDMISNIESSYIIDQIRETLELLIEKITTSRTICTRYLDTLEADTSELISNIKELKITKEKEQELLEKLQSLNQNEKCKSDQFLCYLDEQQCDIEQYKQTRDQIIDNASDFQIFMAIELMQTDVLKKQKTIRSELELFSTKQISFELKIEEDTEDENGDVFDIGLVTNQNKVTIPWDNGTSRFIVGCCDVKTDHPVEQIDDLQLTLNTTVETGIDFITGCLMLHDGRLVFSEMEGVKVFDRSGNEAFKVEAMAYDLTHGLDSNTIVVSSGFNLETCISFIDINLRKVGKVRKVTKTMAYRNRIYSITNVHNRFIFSTDYDGIKMNDESFSYDSQQNIIPDAFSEEGYLAFFGGNVYHSHDESHSVVCYRLSGERVWAFRNQKVLLNPMGVAVASSGNVYVVGEGSNNLVVISRDGKHHRELLTEKDGLLDPRALYYNQSNNQILISNLNDKAFLYDLKCE